MVLEASGDQVTSTTEKDRDCATFARAALFPGRMHRDVAHANHFPALNVLDRYRRQMNERSGGTIAPSSLFPRRVVVVRDLANPDGPVQWNGQPDIDASDASFEVIPRVLLVRCTSDCNKLTEDYKRAFTQKRIGEEGQERSEIILCTDRILQNDYKEPLSSTVAKELPARSLAAVEEVLAHELVKLAHAGDKDITKIEVAAAKAAECYYSRHKYDDKMQVKRGSGLPLGFSLMPGVIQSWAKSSCVITNATKNLQQETELSKAEAQAAVQEALKKGS
jgi:hypothetical protein